MGVLSTITDTVRGWLSPPAAAVRRYESHPNWDIVARQWEAAETNRLNAAHWQRAQDQDINEWLRSNLSTLRARSFYEARNNSLLAGICGTLADDVVGPDGPTLQVLSDDEAYNEALEKVWRDWFAAPTFRKNVSGAVMLKLWVRNLPRAGEFLAQIDTDSEADGPVQMRLKLIPARRLEAPWGTGGDPLHVLGIEFDKQDRPVRYWIKEPEGYGHRYIPVPPDLIIHEFSLDEECQARGFPWFTPSLQPAADLRDFDATVQLAARRAAEDNGMLYSEHPDATLWTAPEETTVEPGVIKMAPPGWKPFAFQATQPAAQYPDFRAERQRDIGRPFCMPLLMIRLDSSKHNYSSARLDTQSYDRMIASIQVWLSGTQQSSGVLNRLVDVIAAEARFSVPELRRRPAKVVYSWTWQPRPHVDPSKEASAEQTGLESRAITLIDALGARGTDIDTHVRKLARVEQAFDAAGVAKPKWMTGQSEAVAAAPPGSGDGEGEEGNSEGNKPAVANQQEAAANA